MPEESAQDLFITIMEKIIRRHETDLVAIMGTDVMSYRK